MSKKLDAIDDDRLNRARKIALQQLNSLKLAGIDVLPQPTGKFQFESLDSAFDSMDALPTPSSTSEQTESTGHVSEAKPTSSYSLETAKPGSYGPELLSLGKRIDQLESLNNNVTACSKCEELAACRKNTVFGVGDPQAELCFLGEGPGADEDRQGEPFVGQAGQLLNKIIEACQLSREEVYIMNTVKCRPPGNRNPNETELANCWPYAIQQLEILQPKFICCLGSIAARTLLNTKQSIGRMRGQFFDFRGSRVVVTYHPAYLLRNPAAKRQVWDDMKVLMAAMGRQI